MEEKGVLFFWVKGEEYFDFDDECKFIIEVYEVSLDFQRFL